MRVALLALIAASIPTASLAAQPAPRQPVAERPLPAGPGDEAQPVDPGEGRAVALKLADELVDLFVYRDQAEAYAAMLRRNAAAGRYDTGKRGEIANRLTEDLLAVHKDGHLRIAIANRRDAGPGHGGGGGALRNGPALIQSAKTIAPGIGYIRFTAFQGNEEEVASVRKWLADNRDAKTLIFDLRNHHGGGLSEQDAIFSYLFAKKTPLVHMAVSKALYDQGNSPLEPGPTLQVVREADKMVATHFAVPVDATPLRQAKVYLLVSNRTASAAEHFALALKSTHRAVLIGEPTTGANHFGGGRPIDEHFAVWMPVGRTYDIKTGKDWEGDGVAPDIAVDPKQALVVALEKAGLGHEDAVKLDAEEVPAEPVHADKLRAR